MNRSKIRKYGPWALAPLIGAAAMLAFLLLHDRGGAIPTPPVAAGDPGTPVAADKLQAIRDFKAFPLYWLGEGFESLALTAIPSFGVDTGTPEMNDIDFIYGTCTPPPGGGGCTPPLVVQVEPLCFTPPAMAGTGDPFDFRGAKALWLEGGRKLGIWTGDSTVFIIGSHDVVMRAANQIVPLGNVPVDLTGSGLQPPNFSSCAGKPVRPMPATPLPHN